MRRKLFLLLFSFSLTQSVVFGNLVLVTAADLSYANGTTGINATHDISSLLGVSPGNFLLTITNGNVHAGGGWTVSNSQSTDFTLTGTGTATGMISHGANLGSDNFSNGPDSQDGFTAVSGESWTFVNAVDPDYTLFEIGNDHYLDYSGPETNQLEAHNTPIRWRSDSTITGFEVWSNNTLNLNNNFTIFFMASTSTPEPSSLVLMLPLLAGGVVRRRRRA